MNFSSFNYNFKLNVSIFVLVFLFNLSDCLYEDQIGKFDWRQHYVGKVKFGEFDPSSKDRIIVATQSNTLAALSAKTGDILWRQILEKSPRGDIKLLHVQSNLNGFAPNAIVNDKHDILTVSGTSPALIRGWSATTGALVWEWSLTPITPEKGENALWFIHESYLYHVIPVYGSHIEVTEYYAISGQPTKTTTSRITAAWIDEAKCVLNAPYFSCTTPTQIISINLLSDKGEVVTKTLDTAFTTPGLPKLVNGNEPALVYDNKLYGFNSEQKFDLKDNDAVFIDDKIVNGKIVIVGTVDRAENMLKLSAKHFNSGDFFYDINTVSEYPSSLGNPDIIAIRCKTSSKSQLACRVLVASADGAIVMIQQGKIKWTREEALADIDSVDFLDLTLSDAEGAIEEELNNKNGDIYAAFTRRLVSQIGQVRNLVLHVFGLGAPPSKAQKAGLVRDDFGLHKMILVVTKYGKIFGIDNVSGKQHWSRYLPNFTSFNAEQGMKLLVQRTSKFYPLAAQCVIIGRHQQTKNGLIYQFNPITGQPINGGIVELPYQIQQLALLQETGADFLRGILLLDEANNAHVLPESSAKYAHNFYLYSADTDKSVLVGLHIEFVDEKLRTTKTWSQNLGGAMGSQKITTIATKNPIEHVHSQGRVLADRSVLYKYNNPNLAAVVTQGPDNVHKYILNMHLIDVVSGSIVFSVSHKRIKGPLHMVHSENWLVYTYYNDKVRRTELTSIELYEGKTQANSTVWSSLDAPPLPLVERQSYILPVTVSALRETITEKGITNKHVLIGLTTGSVVEMTWALLDPRRPVTSPEKAREEGIIPYMPELPLPHENIINYNQTVASMNGIHTSPSGLESTCLVFVYGLDIFVTRISPSKTFDLLKEDFDYFLISVVLIGLTTASYVVKHFASRKAIKQAWK